MPQQGQFTAADLSPSGQPAQQKGQFTAADLDKQPSAYETETRSGPYAPAGAAEKAMGEGRTPGEILKDSALAPAIGASVIAPILTGGASLPVQMGVGAASGAAQSKLEGGSNADAAISGATGGALPLAGPIAGRLAKTIGKAAGGAIDDIPVVRQLGKVAQYWRDTAPEAPAPKYPGAPLPESPSPELSQAAALFHGSSSPVDPAAGLGKIPVAPGQAGQIAQSIQALPSAEVAPNFSRGNLGNLLDKALGAKQLEPNVPLRNQVGGPSAAVQTPADLPEGHTAVQSSAAKSYKYDPDANEFHARYASGNTTYVFGDVAPEEAQAFEQADSKGKALQQMKANHPLVAKIVDGKRIAVKGASGSISSAVDSQ